MKKFTLIALTLLLSLSQFLSAQSTQILNLDLSTVGANTARTFDAQVGDVKTWEFKTNSATDDPFFITGVGNHTEWYGGMLMDETQNSMPFLNSTNFYCEVWTGGTPNRFVANFVWLKEDFLAGFDSEFVGFDATSTIELNEISTDRSQTSSLRFVIEDNGQYYISEAEYIGAGLHSLTDFNNNSTAGKRWGIYNPTTNDFDMPSPLPTFAAHDFTNVTTIGFVYEATKGGFDHNFRFDTFTASAIAVVTYSLTVNSGTGDGSYVESEVIDIEADIPVAGQEFDAWTGDVTNVADVNSYLTTIAIPAADATITATYKALLPGTYVLSVIGGSGTGTYAESANAPIVADPAPAGKEFDAWTGDVAGVTDINSATTTVTIPASSIVITATYKDIVYTLTVNSGTGDGDYLEAAVVNIDADAPPANKIFYRWTGDVANITDVNAASTTIIMPAAAASITATYQDLAVVDFDGSNYGSATLKAIDDIDLVDSIRTWYFDTVTAPIFTASDNQAEWYGGMRIEDGSPSSDPGVNPRLFTGEFWSETNDANNPSSFIANFMWQKQNFLQGLDASTVYFNGSSSIQINVTTLSGTTSTALRFVVKDQGQYYISETEFQGAGLHVLDDFNNSNLTGKRWGVYNPVTDDFGIPSSLPTFDYHIFSDVTQIGFVVESYKGGFHHNFSFNTFRATATDIPTAFYSLTVNNGTGDGGYEESQLASISADAPPAKHVFDMWTGDTAGIADVYSSSTSITMPASDVTLTPLYSVITYPLTVNSGSGSGNYGEDTVVTIVADAPAAEMEFDTWVGSTAYVADVNSATTTITMPAFSSTLLATYKTITYPLTVTSGSGGGDHAKDDVVNITADTPPAGEGFLEWTGDITNIADVNAASTTITMPGTATSITATYYVLPTYTLTVNSGTGDGDHVEDALVDIIADTPPAGQAFRAWTGDVANIADTNDASTIITMPAAATTITAEYYVLPTNTLTVVNGTGSGDYFETEVVNIVADAAPTEQEFDVWTGDVANIAVINAATTTITMPATPATITATYRDITYTLTVTGGTGSGDYVLDEVVNIAADAAPAGQEFAAWTGDVTNVADVNSASTSITMPGSAVNLTATYVNLPTYTLTVTSGTGSGDYLEAEVVSIVADAAPAGQEFDEWTGSVSNVADIALDSTTIAMPAFATAITATYRDTGCVTPTNVDICLAGFDDTSGKNIISWDPLSSDATTVNIYKQTLVGLNYEYVLEGTTNLTNGSYIDNSSDPFTQSNRYKLSTNNDCDDESELGSAHKTMYLIMQAASASVDIYWEAYTGITVSEYNIYRGTSSDNLTLLTSVDASTIYYNDNTAPEGLIYYQIEVVNASGCGSSKSNLVTGMAPNSINDEMINNISVYPNPAANFVTISNLNNVSSVQLVNSIGQVLSSQSVNTDAIMIDISEYSAGLYFIKINQIDNTPLFKELIVK